MSQRIGQEPIALWTVSAQGRRGSRLFAGSLHEVVAHINRLHRESGIPYSARELGQEFGFGASAHHCAGP